VASPPQQWTRTWAPSETPTGCGSKLSCYPKLNGWYIADNRRRTAVELWIIAKKDTITHCPGKATITKLRPAHFHGGVSAAFVRWHSDISYAAEFQFRYNNRENADIFGTAIKGC
jgi:hypothetical protein